jgi:hypothetical protein
MAESQTVTILRAKREEIAAAILNYERQLENARADFAHITAALAIFDAGDKPGSQRPYYPPVPRAFRYGEIAALCRDKLAEGPLSTPELAKHVMTAKGLDAADRVLARSIGFSVPQSMRGMSRRYMVEKLPKSRGRCVWRLTSEGGAASSPSIGAKPGAVRLISQSPQTAPR